MKKIKNLLVKPGISIKHSLKKMDEAGKKILFVVDGDRKILGVVTDGDIRKWILKNHSLDESISKVMNQKPFILKEGFQKEDARQIMLSHTVDCIPVIDDDGRVVSAIWWLDIFDNKYKTRKTINAPVVIMAGGEGVRLHPFTKILPKPLMPIGDKPIIEIIINRFFDHGCADFYLSLNYKSSIIKAYFSDFEHDYKIAYIEESKPLGTAGGLHFLKNRIKRTFFVSNCDILVEADYTDILKFHREKENKITLVSSMKHFTIPYGICEIEKGGTLTRIREKPEFDYLVNTGMYVLEPSVLNVIPKNRFFNITDLINDCLQKNEKVGVYPVSDKAWLDMGQFEALQEMLKKFEIRS